MHTGLFGEKESTMPHFEGQDHINAPREKVWEFIMDPHRYATCSGGTMTNVRVKDDGRFTFDMHAMGRDVSVEAEWANIVPLQHAELTTKGGNMLGKATTRNTIDLSDAPDGGTDVRWAVDASLSGVLKVMEGRIGEMMESMNRSALRCVERELAGAAA
jgi:carbon monoxide dehydrogenase subunit G